MMEKGNKKWHRSSDPALLKLLGAYLKDLRLLQNKTQQEVATIAGLNRSTLVQIENGGGSTLLSFIQILRALEHLHVLEVFEVEKQWRPLLLAKMENSKKARASRKKLPLLKKRKRK